MKYCKMLHQLLLVLNVAALAGFCGCTSEEGPAAAKAPVEAASMSAPSGTPAPPPEAAKTQPPESNETTEARKAAVAADMLQVLRKSDDITTVMAKAAPAAVDAALIGSLSSMENSVREHALKNLCKRDVATTETLMAEAHDLARRIVATPPNLGSADHPKYTFSIRPGEEMQYIVQLMDRLPSEEYVPVLFDIAVEDRFRLVERGYKYTSAGIRTPIKSHGDIIMRVLAALYKCSDGKITELRPGPERKMPALGPRRVAWIKKLRVKWEEETRSQK